MDRENQVHHLLLGIPYLAVLPIHPDPLEAVLLHEVANDGILAGARRPYECDEHD
jgi:hypothetical protein